MPVITNKYEKKCVLNHGAKGLYQANHLKKIPHRLSRTRLSELEGFEQTGPGWGQKHTWGTNNPEPDERDLSHQRFALKQKTITDHIILENTPDATTGLYNDDRASSAKASNNKGKGSDGDDMVKGDFCRSKRKTIMTDLTTPEKKKKKSDGK